MKKRIQKGRLYGLSLFQQKLLENFEFLLEQAIQLREEVPDWSVAQIIYILEAEGLAAPGVLKRSTLEWHIYKAGYGQKIIEDTFHQVVSRYGTFDACYFDNGTQYIAKQIRSFLARLGIRVMYAKLRSGKSKGKIEKFHQVLDAFIRESKLKNIKTLEELNRLWTIYLEKYYHKKKHDGIAEYYESFGAAILEEGISQLQEWNRDSRPLTFLDTTVVAEAFLHHEQRKVDKGACISFRGQRYEIKPALIGYTVEIS